LLTEKLKGEDSDWKPFLDYLPKQNDTLFTLPSDTKSSHVDSKSETLFSACQYHSGDLSTKVEYDRGINRESRQRFKAFLEMHLKEITDKNSVDDYMELFDWAWMNLATRCFGHYHFPCDIAMCPLIDLVNHQQS